MKTKQEMRQIHKKFNLFHPPRICFFYIGLVLFPLLEKNVSFINIHFPEENRNKHDKGRQNE